MDTRRKIGILFSYNPNWIAGTYYVQNLVHSLLTLPESEQPCLVVMCQQVSDFEYLKRQTKYPFLEQRIVRMPLVLRTANRVIRRFWGRNIFYSNVKTSDVEYVFPLMTYESNLPQPSKYIYWIPDFQEDYLPEFFSAEEIEIRRKTCQLMANSSNKMVFSSHDTLSDFNRLCPQASSTTFVMPFAVTLPDYSSVDIVSVCAQYGVSGKYFFCANQFWVHKNHITVIKAVKELKDRGVEVQILFSGKTSDYRNAAHFELLERYIIDNGLSDNVRFLGFLDRHIQLALMRSAIAVVQPSLFEGWSTVVEDCKAMGQFIILSSLGVHKEQISENAAFFDPHSSQDLALLLEKYQTEEVTVVSIDYAKSIAAFGRKFIEMINS